MAPMANSLCVAAAAPDGKTLQLAAAGFTCHRLTMTEPGTPDANLAYAAGLAVGFWKDLDELRGNLSPRRNVKAVPVPERVSER